MQIFDRVGAAMLIILVSAAAPVSAQLLTDPPVRWQQPARATPGWLPPLASAVFPGSGQLLQGSKRGLVYAFLEAGFLAGYVLAADAGGDHRDRYRGLAFDVARAPFQPAVRDTAFQYFEQMTKFTESGPFDAAPAAGIQPPGDPGTFNGRIWLLARQTFFPDPGAPPPVDSPAYGRALDFYRARAVGPGFQWSWVGEEADYSAFRDFFDRSDDAFQLGTQFLGVLLVNHLVSVVDAIIASRLGTESRWVAAWVRAGAVPMSASRVDLGLMMTF